jgi:hypothetical protein
MLLARVTMVTHATTTVLPKRLSEAHLHPDLPASERT